MRHNTWQVAVLLALVSWSNATVVQADTLLNDSAFDSMSAYAGQGANHNLLELPGAVATARLNWENLFSPR